MKEIKELKQENHQLKSYLSKTHKDSHSKLSIAGNTTRKKKNYLNFMLSYSEYKTSNAETLSTNDQSVFESHISLLEKPIYSLCKNNPNNNFDTKPIISQKNNYLSNIEKSSFLLFSSFS